MRPSDQHWYRQPIAWLAVAILAVTLAGCIHLILFALAHEDPALVVNDQETSFRIPATRQPAQAPDTPTPDTP